MFEYMGDRLSNAIKNIKGLGKITEDNINDAVKEIRLALLEADVNYTVVKEFINNIKEKALGLEVSQKVNPDEMFIKLIKDELVNLLGVNYTPLVTDKSFCSLMLVGLQGSGKTTTAGKLANYLRKKHSKKVLLIAADVYRPAAIDQLVTLGKQLDIPVYKESDSKDVLSIVNNGMKYAKDNGCNYVIIDTAGRLQIDDELMDELDSISKAIQLDEKLLVVDAMMGQDAINVINGFNDKLNLTGAIITKLDGNTKGGVSLSIKHLTGLPIKFAGDSEKLDGLSEFYPERMAERILDMGDIWAIANKVEGLIDENDAKEQAARMKSGKFDLEDFLKALNQIKKMGPLENLLKLMPGARKMGLNNISIDKKQFDGVEAIILSMTKEERRNPEILKASRKIRIAKGSGKSVEEINRLLKQFEEMKKMMKTFSNGNMKLPF